MPLIRLEYTQGLCLNNDAIKQFFFSLHGILNATVDAEINSCKSCAFCSPTYCLGDDLNGDFAILHIGLFAGRSQQALDTLQEKAMEALQAMITEQRQDPDSLIQCRILLFSIEAENYSMLTINGQ